MQQWHLSTGELLAEFQGHKAGVVCLALAGDLLLAGGGDGHVLLFDLKATSKGVNQAVTWRLQRLKSQVSQVESVYKAAWSRRGVFRSPGGGLCLQPGDLRRSAAGA